MAEGAAAPMNAISQISGSRLCHCLHNALVCFKLPLDCLFPTPAVNLQLMLVRQAYSGEHVDGRLLFVLG